MNGSPADLEEMKAAFQMLREQGLNPAEHTALGSVDSIAQLWRIMRPEERGPYLLIVLDGVNRLIERQVLAIADAVSKDVH